MATQEVRVRIKQIDGKFLSSEYNIKTAPDINQSGDIDLFDSADPKEVKFILAQKLRDGGSNNPSYKFLPTPFCAYIDNVGPQDCQPGDMPTGSGWTLQPNPPVNWKFVLNVPAKANPSNNEYIYKLFMERTKDGVPKNIVIDPRIKDGGGYGFRDVSTFAGYEIWTLGLLMVFAFATGGMLGWTLRKP